ncbi:MAG TPA: hypothetical protein DCE41_04775 [Cytophagales bacterium]|nr:hypothetical protein [Cytophagales bacterium]HAA18776.1 hypothetical protein [Cytophagales bacterium]HAP64255.1 hypothetical protein [Cytophagales bacterium]
MELSLDNIQAQIHPSWYSAAEELLPLVGPIVWPYEGTVQADILVDEEWEVLIQLENDKVLSFSCTCGDESPICIHVVAVLLKLQLEQE